MRIAARAFLGMGVQAGTGATEDDLKKLPEPVWLAALRQALRKNTIAFADIGWSPVRQTTAEGIRFRRMMRVRSFVWEGAMYVIRPQFSDRHFHAWPDPLQCIWRDTLIDTGSGVSDGGDCPPRQE